MSHTLTRFQAIVLGAVVAMALGLSGVGLARIAGNSGYWADTVELTAGFAEVHDVSPGTPVRIRGVNAGQVIAIEYPESDAPGAAVTVRMRINQQFAERIYADGTVRVQPTGLLGSKVVAITPGQPTSGPTSGQLRAEESTDFAQAAAKLDKIADKLTIAVEETSGLVSDIRTGKGTLPKLIRDDDLYEDLKGLSKDTRTVLKRADGALGVVETEAGNVRNLVQDGRDTLRSVKQGTDAVQRMPIIRGYVEDQARLLTRPECRREAMSYNSRDLFEPESAILTDAGKQHLVTVSDWIKQSPDTVDIVVVSQCDPQSANRTAASADELTRKQSEVVVEYLKEQGAHKTGWFARRTMTPVGLGFGPSPIPVPTSVAPSYLRVLAFTPQS